MLNRKIRIVGSSSSKHGFAVNIFNELKKIHGEQVVMNLNENLGNRIDYLALRESTDDVLVTFATDMVKDHFSELNAHWLKMHDIADHIFTFQAENKNLLPRAIPISYAVDTSLYYPRGSKEEYDIGFIGRAWLTSRVDTLSKLKESFNCSVNFENCWGEDAAKTYDKCKMIYNNCCGATITNFRFYEALAMGKLLLQDNYNNPVDGIEAGKHFVLYSGYSDLVNKIYYYLHNDKERIEIATAGLKAVQRHTYRKRAIQILNHLHEGPNGKPLK